MDNFLAALSAIHDLKSDGIVRDYAIGGAIGTTFWAEAVPTYDLDVFVLYQSQGVILSLTPIYKWATARGYQIVDEHIVIAGIPVQILPAPNQLAEEAIANAAELPYESETARVITPEYLIAMFLEKTARSQKRLARVGMLLELPTLDRRLLNDVLGRYNLKLPRDDHAS